MTTSVVRADQRSRRARVRSPALDASEPTRQNHSALWPAEEADAAVPDLPDLRDGDACRSIDTQNALQLVVHFELTGWPFNFSSIEACALEAGDWPRAEIRSNQGMLGLSFQEQVTRDHLLVADGASSWAPTLAAVLRLCRRPSCQRWQPDRHARSRRFSREQQRPGSIRGHHAAPVVPASIDHHDLVFGSQLVVGVLAIG